AQLLNKEKVMILFLQETHMDKTENRALLSHPAWPTKWQFQSKGTKKSRGVGILFKNDLDIQVKEIVIDTQERFIMVKCLIWGQNIP
ncbi:hypothetical protein JRQ81_003250, partial [Phrynocephalus forsythii]